MSTSGRTKGAAAALLPRGNAGEALEENREASEGGAAEAVDGLSIVAYGDDAAMVPRQTPKKLDLRDVRVLEFVHQNVAVTLAERGGKGRVPVQQMYGIQQLHAECKHAAFAKQSVARPIGARDLPLFADRLFANTPFVLGQPVFLSLVAFRQRFGIALVIVRCNQLVLAAREKLHKIAQELPRFG